MTARTTMAVVAGMLGLGLLAGCPDPNERFDEFIARYDASPFNQGQGGAEFCPAAAPMGMERDGEYFFSLTPLPDSPDKPAPFIATVTVTANELTIELLPLNADNRTTVAVDPDTMMPFGSQTFGPFPIEADGTTTIELLGATVPGETNPLTANELTVDATLEGAFCTDTDSLCGEFNGVLTGPPALAGLELRGTWNMVKIEGGTFPDGTWPEPPPTNCAGDLAAAF